ncbi:MAG: ABC transporter permease [Chloroherpetonaceae bacterium]|nr:ABC transporter permease [Chloroherpetonaceae bacterium]
MKTFLILLEKELRETFHSTRFLITFSLSTILILLTFYTGIRSYTLSKERHEADVKAVLKKYEGYTDWRLISGHQVQIPPTFLSALVMGVSNDIGQQITVQASGELSSTNSYFSQNPIYAVFKALDLSFLFQVILSLVAIVFAFNSVCGEKENATLALIFSGSIPRATFILSKVIGAYLSLTLPLVIPFLLSFILIEVLSVSLTLEEWLKLLGIIGLGFLYLGVFITLSVAVSTFTVRSANSFSILLSLWVIMVIVLPKASIMLAGRAVEVPNLDAISKEKSQYSRQLWSETQKRMSEFKSPNDTNPETAMKKFNEFMSKESEEREVKFSALAKRLNEERSNREKVRESLAINIAKVSPSAVFAISAATLAETDISLKNLFHENAANYQKVFGEFQYSKTGVKQGGGFRMFFSQQGNAPPKPIDVSELPVFQFKGKDLAALFQEVFVDGVLLLLFSILLTAIAFKRFLNYDLR